MNKAIEKFEALRVCASCKGLYSLRTCVGRMTCKRLRAFDKKMVHMDHTETLADEFICPYVMPVYVFERLTKRRVTDLRAPLVFNTREDVLRMRYQTFQYNLSPDSPTYTLDMVNEYNSCAKEFDFPNFDEDPWLRKARIAGEQRMTPLEEKINNGGVKPGCLSTRDFELALFDQHSFPILEDGIHPMQNFTPLILFFTAPLRIWISSDVWAGNE